MIQDGYSICFNKWVLDTRIKNELPLLLIISSLTAKTGECFASNQYFATLFNCTEVSISQKINKLIKIGYISAEYEKRGAEIKRRVLRLKNFLTDDLNIFYPTIKNIFKDNNISNNNTSNKKEIYKEKFEEWWSYFPKLRAGSKEKAYQSFVRTIIKEKVTPEWLIEKIKEYAESEEVKKGYACGGARYFNDCKYNNQYKTGTDINYLEQSLKELGL